MLAVAKRDRICLSISLGVVSLSNHSTSAKSPCRLTVSAARTNMVRLTRRTVCPEPPRNARRRTHHPCLTKDCKKREKTPDPLIAARPLNCRASDTGKTNILEALGFLSGLGWAWSLGTSLRLRPELGFDPLFYRQCFDQPFQISLHLGAPPAAHQAQQVKLKAAIAGGPDRRLEISFPSYGSPTVNPDPKFFPTLSPLCSSPPLGERRR